LGFALVLVAATGLVVSAGGLVTGADAGFSVPDWPQSFGANMFLLPLSKMTGGIYYEHAHRLAGTLVGLTALVFMVHAWLVDRRNGVRVLALVAFICVCVQGLIGAAWVLEGAEELNEAAAANAARAQMPFGLVVFHGVFGQVVLGLMVALAVVLMRIWRFAEPVRTESASTDRAFNLMLLGAIVIQLTLGVILRKTGGMLLIHISFATIVVMLALAAGIRTYAIHGQRWRPLKYIGGGITFLVILQLVLGFAALIVRESNQHQVLVVGADTVSPAADAFVTTLHQSAGAALLSLATAQLLLAWRLVRPAPASESRPAADRPHNHQGKTPDLQGTA
jgi:cytochrome c oxidase assembly protein subunit 15